MGINVIRVPVSRRRSPAPIPRAWPRSEEPLRRLCIANSLAALEQVITAADAKNVYVLLDIHSCSNYVGWRKGRLDARPP